MIVLYSKFSESLSEEKLLALMSELPVQFVNNTNGFRNLKDRYGRLFGRLLLKKGLIMINSMLGLEDIVYTPFNRPYFVKQVDFSISHSGEAVVCVISDCHRVGIDLEKHTRLEDFSDYGDMFTRNDWEAINSNLGTNGLFYEYWTKKEAIMKADGRGISNAFANLEITSKDVFILEDENWYSTRLNLYNEYTCHLAYNSMDIEIETLEIVF